ncbi:tetratricopeptide repeat protein [Tundrisphaera lichenicola]|uniref:tetratricopeptide repeat protein n=1 Tax=Tundrisphaera lichenicola TaxID=2029860 RepID=UPI003EBC33D5
MMGRLRLFAIVLAGVVSLVMDPPRIKAEGPAQAPAVRPAPLPPQPDEIAPIPPDEPSPEDGGLAAYNFTMDQAIEFFRAKVAANPADFHSYRYLGDLYDRKAKQTGDLASFAEAEKALRASLKLFPDHPKTEAALASVLCSRHQFVEGLAIARKLLAEDPGDIDALATMSDALLEIGRYEEGEETLRKLHRAVPVAEVLARLANLAELKGNTEEATSLMSEAAGLVRKSGKPKADAWYLAILGDFAFNAGRIEEAKGFYQRVPEGVDSFHDATYGLARVAFVEGDLDLAIDRMKQAVAIGPDAHMLAALGDLLVKAGRPDEAKSAYDRVFEVTGDDSERRRALAKFLADHDRDLPRALELARKDHAERQDVFGSDNLAWCLYKNGQVEEAAKVMDDALRLGIKDPNFYFHAGMIRKKLGDAEQARTYLGKALAINPKFAILQADEARKALESPEEPARKP